MILRDRRRAPVDRREPVGTMNDLPLRWYVRNLSRDVRQASPLFVTGHKDINQIRKDREMDEKEHCVEHHRAMGCHWHIKTKGCLGRYLSLERKGKWVPVQCLPKIVRDRLVWIKRFSHATTIETFMAQEKRLAVWRERFARSTQTKGKTS